MTLQDIDRNTILKSFAIDSENRGYSDKAKEAIENDKKILQELNLDKKTQESILKNTELILINMRKLMLSKNQEEYLKNKIEVITLFYCYYEIIPDHSRAPTKNLLIVDLDSSKIETNDFGLIYKILQEKHYLNIPYNQIVQINNPQLTKEECIEKINN